jgi:hypothetical protein
VPLGNKHVADLYPWATKRFLSSLPLAMALGAASVYRLAEKRGVVRRAFALGVLVLAVGWNARQMAHAWSRVEYKGLHKILTALADEIGPRDIVVADHFLWATPLTLSLDRPVLNGEPLWQNPTADHIQRANALLSQWRAEGRRVLLLTSTDGGPGLFPGPIGQGVAIMEPVSYPYRVIAHHRSSRGFWARDEEAQFLLSEWHPREVTP